MMVPVLDILVSLRLINLLEGHFGGHIYIEMSASMSNSVFGAKLLRQKEFELQAYCIHCRFWNQIGKVYQWILLLGYPELSNRKIPFW